MMLYMVVRPVRDHELRLPLLTRLMTISRTNHIQDGAPMKVQAIDSIKMAGVKDPGSIDS